MNALEKYRIDRCLTYDELALELSKSKASVWRHCLADAIPGDAAMEYNKRLGIPLESLRPDIYGDKQPEQKKDTKDAAA